MRPDKQSITDLFAERVQYLIPLFQRGYVWQLKDIDKAQVRYLWEDIADRALELEKHENRVNAVDDERHLRPMQKHFLGSIVVGAKDERGSTRVETREVIDGQQRLTTLQIFLFALRDVVGKYGDELLVEDLKRVTRNRGDYDNETDLMKVLPTNIGRDEMIALFHASSVDQVLQLYPSGRGLERPLMVEAYLYFNWMIEQFIRGRDHDEPIEHKRREDFTLADQVIRSIKRTKSLAPVLEADPDLSRARILYKAVDRYFEVMKLRLEDEDDPQVIFETLNARGEPLKPSDLIRNFVFLDAARKEENVDKLYQKHWSVFDEDTGLDGAKFWRKEQRQGRLKNTRLDLLFYHYTTLQQRSVLKVSHVFSRFKDWWTHNPDRIVADELERIMRLSGYFRSMLEPSGDDFLDKFSRRVLLLDTTSQTPLILLFLEKFGPTSAEFQQAANDLESYLLRRFVCGLTTKAYNRTFNERLLGAMTNDEGPSASRLRQELLALEGESQRWPDDLEFEQAWRTNRLYKGANTRRVQAILLGLEEMQTGAKQELLIKADNLTVEHVLPQEWKSQDYPLSDETPEASERRDRLIHSIGNLTLVTGSFNAALSNDAFAKKRPEIARQSQLRLNAYFQSYQDNDQWLEDDIDERARTLFPIALEKWGRPKSA